MKKGSLLIAAALCLDFLYANDPAVDLRGYSNSNIMVYSIPEGYGLLGIEEKEYFSFSNSSRISLITTPVEQLTIEAAYSVLPSVSELDASLFSFNSPSVEKYRIADLPDNITEYDNGGIGENLDRLVFQIRTPFADMTLGRQAISFGSARFFNPTDVFSPFSYQDLNKEEKAGVDAVRIQIPIGEMSEIDAGYIFGEYADWKKSAAFLKGRFDIKGTEISVIAMEYRTHLMAGLNISSNIKGAGVWFEGAYTFARLLDDYDNDEDFFRISAGAEYYFTGDFYIFGEYHYSYAGTLESREYILNSFENKTAYQDSGVYLLGEHYFAPGLNWQVHPLVNLSLQVLLNCSDPSAMIIPKISWSVDDNLMLDLGATINAGRRISSKGLNSEFGSYPDSYYLSMRMYF